MTARTVAGRERGSGKSLLCDPGSELRVGRREKKLCEDNKWDEQKKKKKKYRPVHFGAEHTFESGVYV